MSAVQIRTPRLLLRTLTPDDREPFVAAEEASAEFWRAWSPAVPGGQDDSPDGHFARALERIEKDRTLGDGVRFAGFTADGQIAAFVSLNNNVRGVFHNGYMGWRVSAPFARQGYGAEAVIAMLDFAFAGQPHGLGLHRVQANVIPRNVPSIRLAEKVGFRREGLALRYLQINGAWEDHIMFAKLSDEHAPVYFTS